MAGRARRPFSPPSSGSSSSGKIRVPALATDPVASLRPWPMTVDIYGTEVEIPELSACDWLTIFLTPEPDLDDVGLVLVPELGEAIDHALYSGLLSFEDQLNLILDLIEQAAGRPWHIALRLIATVRASWDVLGPEMRRWCDPTVVSLSAWLDTALIVILRAMEEKDVPMFTMRLEAPLPGKADDELEMSPDDFSALMSG